MSYAGPISIARALMYGYMSGSNDYTVNAKGFEHACFMYGVDNPVPMVTNRLAVYGNSEQVISQIGQSDVLTL